MRLTTKVALGALLCCACAAVSFAVPGVQAARAQSASDFFSDVQAGLGSEPRAAATAIRRQDYQSAWDEFGTNILVDGARPSADIQQALQDDIINDLQTQLTYYQREERYLQLEGSTPEEVIAAEGDGGNDLLPQDAINPNPSLEANPEVPFSALDTDTSAAGVPGPSDAASLQADPSIPDSLVPQSGEWRPSDINVFETIIQATTTPAEVSPQGGTDAAPSAPPLPDTQSPDTSTN